MRQRDLIIEYKIRQRVEYLKDHHPKPMEDSTQNNQQHHYQYKAHQILHVAGKSMRTGELIRLIRDHIPLIRPSELAQKDLRFHRITVILDKLSLFVLPLHHEDRVTHRKHQGLGETSGNKHLVCKGYLQCEKDYIWNDDAQHIAKDVVVVEHLVGYPLAHVITDYLHVRKKRVIVPVIHKVLVIDSALDIVHSNLVSEFLELVVDGEDIHAYFVQVADFEVLFDQHVAELRAFHV